MKNVLIIVSGMAAAGKTTYANWLSQETCIPLLSVDDLWEKYGDYHFAMSQFWNQCEKLMKQSSPLIIEYGFGEEQKQIISEMVEKYIFKSINVHFSIPIEVAHHRFNDRRKYDMGNTKPQITLEDYTEMAEQPMKFQFGDCVIRVDSTDFTRVSYESILMQIQQNAECAK